MKYCYQCGAKYEVEQCPNCGSTIYTEKPNTQTDIKYLVTDVTGSLGFLVNDLTKEMDTYLTYESEEYLTNNYIYDKYKDKWSIRCIGATRGHIQVDENNIIQKIELYKDSDSIYNLGIRECFEKYIGMQVEIKKNLLINRDFSHKSSPFENIAAAMLEHIAENNGRVNNE